MNKLVEIQGDQIVTTSLIVAREFRFSHTCIKEMIAKLETTLDEPENTLFKLKKEKFKCTGNLKNPKYILDKDVFYLLAIQFSNAVNLQIIYNFLQAFNEAESLLQGSKSISSILRRLAKTLEEKENTEKKTDISKSKPKALKIVRSTTITKVAKKLKLRLYKLTDWLMEEGYIEEIRKSWKTVSVIKRPTEKGEPFFVTFASGGLHVYPAGVDLLLDTIKNGRIPKDCFKEPLP